MARFLKQLRCHKIISEASTTNKPTDLDIMHQIEAFLYLVYDNNIEKWQKTINILSKINAGVGFQKIEPQDNVVVAYAARHGTLAGDGNPGGNSPYTEALARRMAQIDLEIGMVFRKVRADVQGS